MANLRVGIVGLPNAGKSTLFNALLKKQTAHVANYPFATIEPNIGIVEVPDVRLPQLAKVVGTEKIVPAVVEFYDIAGLVKGASQGEGLGNQFLSHIREVDAIAHVVRLFDESDIPHVSNKIDPADDITTIEEELILADLQTLEKQKEPKGNASKEEVATYEIVKKVRERLDQGIPVRNQKLSDQDLLLIRHLNLLTAKPVIVCFNCSLEQLEEKDKTVQNIVQGSSLLFHPLVEETLDGLITKAYETLNLISFLTAGEKEVRAWTIAKGTTASQAAGVIHSDFEKHFIKAEVVSFDNFVKSQGWTRAREQGLVQIVGRDYVIEEGNVVDFKVNV